MVGYLLKISALLVERVNFADRQRNIGNWFLHTIVNDATKENALKIANHANSWFMKI